MEGNIMDRGRKLLTVFLIIILAGIVTLIVKFSPENVRHADTNSLPDRQESHDFSNAPTELVLASLEAYGGSDKIKSLKTLILKNLITVYGQDRSKVKGRSTEYYNFPDMVRVDFRFDEESVSHLFDGLEAWVIQAGKESKAPDFMAESMRRSAKHFPMTLLSNALSERSLLNDIGTDIFNKKKTFTLSITDGEGDQSKVWLDAETLLIARLDYVVFSSLGADSMSVVTSDYRELDGIQTAYRATIYYNGEKAQETFVEEVEYNPDLPVSLFTPSSGEE
jgi:hypothetical protein